MLGCASVSLEPIADPTKRIEFAGFSILPPQGPQWARGSAETLPSTESGVVYRAVFFRTPAETDRTSGTSPRVLAVVMVRDLGETRFRSPADFVNSMRTLGARTRQRYKILGSGASLVERADATCAAYDYEAEDAGVVLTVRGVRCLHPQWPNYAVDVSYNQRHPAGQPPIAMDAEVDPFLRSLEFTPDRP